MDYRRIAAVERGTLHQSFLSAECKTGGTEARDSDRSPTSNRAGGGNLCLEAGDAQSA